MVPKPQVTIAHLLVWTTAVGCLMAYTRLMPLATTVPDNSHGTLLFTLLFSVLGGIGLGGLFFWHGSRDLMTYLQFLTPLIAAGVFFYALFGNGVRPRRTVGHWIGVLLLVILVGQTLHFAGWTQMFWLLIPEP